MTTDIQQSKSDEERFVNWLITQTNSNGTLYLERVARQYTRYLRTSPFKLNMALEQHSRNVFACKTSEQFEELYRLFVGCRNFIEVNACGHQSFSAGLAAYRRYVKYLESAETIEMPEFQKLNINSKKTREVFPIGVELRRVDFAHPELCSGCAPVSCVVEGNEFNCGNWRDILVSLTEVFLQCKPEAEKLYHAALYPNGERALLLRDKPKFSPRKLSNGYWINVNRCIKDLVFCIGRLCELCDVDLDDVNITYVPKQNSEETQSTNKTADDSGRFAQQTVRDTFRSWLAANHPEWSSDTVTLHCSDAYYLYNNNRGITLEEALTTDDGLQRAYEAIKLFYTDNPTETNNPPDLAYVYIRSLCMLKQFLYEIYPEMLNANSAVNSLPSIPDSVIDELSRMYASGFRFDMTYINLLSKVSGVDIDGRMQAALKRIMFCRDDGIYFLLDTIADATTRKNLVDCADSYLQEYGCFELSEFYKLYEEKVNPSCIRNVADFESFFEQIAKRGVRCVQAPYIGNRIVRYSNGAVWTTFKEVAAKIVTIIANKYYGSCNEDDLHTAFCVFSTDLLGKIIKQCAADKLIRVEINDSVCYQIFDALGLPENFSEVLAQVLEQLSLIGLEPSQDVLHTALSLKLGMNFMAEYNLPDWDAFKRLISTFYRAKPCREWESKIFVEVNG